MVIEITKTQEKIIQEYFKYFEIAKIVNNIDMVRGQEIDEIIVISLGRKKLHCSGYPLLLCIGHSHKDKKFYSLGYHDHIVCGTTCNIDCLSSSIYRLMNYSSRISWKVSDSFISCSTLSVGDYGILETEKVEIVR